MSIPSRWHVSAMVTVLILAATASVSAAREVPLIASKTVVAFEDAMPGVAPADGAQDAVFLDAAGVVIQPDKLSGRPSGDSNSPSVS